MVGAFFMPKVLTVKMFAEKSVCFMRRKRGCD